MTTPKSRRIDAALARRSGNGASVEQVADTVVAMWHDIERELSPIVGTRGVAALHGRSLFLAARQFPWLNGAPDGGHLSMDMAALRAKIVRWQATEALQACGASFAVFHELLASMVGPALTERLLLPVWDTPSSGQPAQDLLP